MRDPSRRRLPLSERLVEVIDERQTGETILDEALKMIKGQEEAKLGVNAWIDLLSGTLILLRLLLSNFRLLFSYHSYNALSSASLPFAYHRASYL